MNPLNHFIKIDKHSKNNKNWDTGQYQQQLSDESDYKNLTAKERYDYNREQSMTMGHIMPSYEEYIETQKRRKK